MGESKNPSLLEICKAAFYIGVIGYGGPAILAQMKKTFSHEKKWVSEREFMEALSLAQVLPGATGVSIMGYLGYKLQRFWGGVLVPLSFITPAIVAVLVLSWIYFTYGNLPFVRSLFLGLGALVVGLLVNAIGQLSKSVFRKLDFGDVKGGLISIVTFTGIFFLHTSVIYLILLAGLLGILLFYFTGEFEGERLEKDETHQNKIIITPKRLKKEDYLPLILVAALVAVITVFPVLRQIFLAFFKIGMFAFGGGFTTIPLIQHEVVEGLHWLNTKQFVDGIALGQVTPGPVFITATFIGYKVWGILGGLVATLAVFMPSLIAIIALADLHAKVKKAKIVQVIIRGFLSGFIGLLVAVALQFGLKSLISWQAWLICLVTIIWMMFLKKNAVWAIIGTMIFSLLFIK